MIFGVSIGDFIAIADLTKRAISGIKTAPEDFSETVKTLQNLDILLNSLRSDIESSTSLLTRDADHAKHFDILIRQFAKPLNRLLVIIEQYRSLGLGKAKLLDRVRFPQKDVLEIQQELARRYATLTTFLETVGIGGIGRIETSSEQTRQRVDSVSGKIDDVQRTVLDINGKIDTVGNQLDDAHDGITGICNSIEFVRLQQTRILTAVEKLATKRSRLLDTGSLLSDHTNDDKSVWRQLRRDLNIAGFKSCVIERHKMLIHRKFIELQRIGLLDWDAASVADDSTISTRTFTGHPRNDYKPPTMSPILEESRKIYGKHTANYDASTFRSRACSSSHKLHAREKGISHYRAPSAQTVLEDCDDNDETTTSDFDRRPVGSRDLPVLGTDGTIAPHVPEPGSSYFNADRMADIVKVDDDCVYLETKEGESIKLALSELSLNEAKRVDRWRWQQTVVPMAAPAEPCQQIEAYHATEDENSVIQDDGTSRRSSRAESFDSDPMYDTKVLVGRRSKIAVTWKYRLPGEQVEHPAPPCRTHSRTNTVFCDKIPLAAEYGDIARLRELINRGYNIEATGRPLDSRRGKRVESRYSERTALWRAAFNEDLRTAQFLLRSGANPNARTKRGRLVQCLMQRKRIAMVRLLLEYDVEFRALGLLEQATKFGDEEAVRLLLDFGADVNGSPRHEGNDLSWTETLSPPIYEAAKGGFTRILDLLLREGADHGYVPWRRGPTALYWAAHNSANRCVELLLSYGADPNLGVGLYGDSPLYVACVMTNACTVRTLLRRHADPNKSCVRPSSRTRTTSLPEIFAITYNSAPLLNKYLAGTSPLHWAAEKGEVEIVSLLLAYGADVEAKGEVGITAMEYAEMGRHSDVINLLRQPEEQSSSALLRLDADELMAQAQDRRLAKLAECVSRLFVS